VEINLLQAALPAAVLVERDFLGCGDLDHVLLGAGDSICEHVQMINEIHPIALYCDPFFVEAATLRFFSARSLATGPASNELDRWSVVVRLRTSTCQV
jgi:hypothetical protein